PVMKSPAGRRQIWGALATGEARPPRGAPVPSGETLVFQPFPRGSVFATSRLGRTKPMITLDPAIDETSAHELATLTLGAVLRAQRAGAQIVDTRSPADFACGHLACRTP